MKVRQVPLGDIKPYPTNPRRDHDVERIAASLKAFGWRQPIVVWEGDGYVVAGHGRLLAAQHLGQAKVPVHYVPTSEMSEAQARAYRIADNRSAEGSGWDERALLAEMELLDEDARRDAGFEEAELDETRRRVEQEDLQRREDENDVPEVPASPVSARGDLWVLGEHLLLCGDATNANDVSLLGEHGHLMVTDPPYGVDYDPDWRNRDRMGARSIGVVASDDRADWEPAWRLFVGDVAYVWSAPGANLLVSGAALVRSGFDLRTQIVWRKQQFVIGRGNYHLQHEPCWYAVRKGAKAHWRGDRTQSTVWDVANASAFGGDVEGEIKTSHSTQKPVEIMRRPMINNSNTGELVYDPFCGSGTTIIAAESVGRRARCIEIDPGYVDVAVERWQRYTGKVATFAGAGETFDQIREVRADGSMVAVAR